MKLKNKLLITDYAKKNKEQKRWQPHANHDSYTFPSMRWSVFFFYLRRKRKRTFKHLVRTKLMGENTITNIMKVSVAGTSLKESEKNVYES